MKDETQILEKNERIERKKERNKEMLFWWGMKKDI